MLRLGNGQAEVVVDAHDLAGGFHLRAEQGVHAAERSKGKTASLTAQCADGSTSSVKPSSSSVLPEHDLGGELGQRDADGLADEGTVREARGLTSST
jgi:hypothetical protein